MTKPVHIERDVEAELWETARTWAASSSRFQWISLLTAPGRGNTRILNQFRERASRDEYGLKHTRVIYICGRDAFEERPPSAPGDFAEALAPFYTVRGPVSDLWHRLLECDRLQILKLLLLGLLLLIVFMGGLALDKYNDDATVPLLTIEYWISFLTQWVPSNLYRMPAWLGLAFLFWVLATLASRLLPRRSLATPSEVGRDSGALVELVARSAAKKTGVILLVDHASKIAPVDQMTLRDLATARSDGRFQAAADIRVLVITVDPEESGNQTRKEAGVPGIDLTVAPLSDTDLETLIQARWPDLTGAQVLDKLADARLSLKTAFGDAQSDETRHEVSAAMAKAQRDSINEVFDDYKMVVVWSVRRIPKITKSELFAWAQTFDGELFGWRSEKNLVDLVKALSHSVIAEQDGKTIYFDLERCHHVARWTAANDAAALVAAHCYWGAFLSGRQEPSSTASAPALVSSRDAARHREAGWHLARVSTLVEDVTTLFPTAAPSVRAGFFEAAATALLDGAAVRQEEGEFGEAIDLLLDALEWAPRLVATGEDFRQRTTSLVWANYWFLGEDLRPDRVDELRKAGLLADQSREWLAHDSLRRALMCDVAVPVPGDGRLVSNVAILAKLLTDARTEVGFLSTALKEGAVSVSDPIRSKDYDWAEFRLHQLRVKQALLRRDTGAAHQALLEYRKRLECFSARRGVVLQLLLQYDEALYRHLLLWLLESGQDAVVDVQALWPEPLEPFQDAASARAALIRSARKLYMSVLEGTSILGMKPLLSECAFQFGELLKAYGGARQTAAVDGWKGWETWFRLCLDLDRQLKWLFRAPVIHQARWEYFREEDRNTAVTDAFHTLHAIREARFPTKMLLEWHQMTSAVLNDFGDSDHDRKRSAELHEMWARHLCMLPEATQRRFKNNVAFEQSHNLMFAAQAYRNSHDYRRADELLSEAETLWVTGGSDTEHVEDAEEVRRLQLALRLQRTWLTKDADGSGTRYQELLAAFWKDLRLTDPLFSNTMASVLWEEARLGTLGESWPPAGTGLGVDPGNDQIVIPESWFAEYDCTIRNRFEFRLMQLLLAGCGHPAPPQQQVMARALLEFSRQEHFADTALSFGELELAHAYCSPANRATLVDLLGGVRFYFQHCRPQDQQEMRALHQLTRFEPENVNHRVAYVTLVLRYGDLLKREIELQPIGELDFFDIVMRIHNYLQVLVDEQLAAEQFVTRAKGTAGDPDVLVEQVRDRRRAVEAAEARLTVSQPADAVDLLRPFVPQEVPSWVFIEDLRLLHTFGRAAAATGAHVAEAQRSLRLLNKSALRYIAQYSATIKDPGVQQLSMSLLNALRAHLTELQPLAQTA